MTAPFAARAPAARRGARGGGAAAAAALLLAALASLASVAAALGHATPGPLARASRSLRSVWVPPAPAFSWAPPPLEACAPLDPLVLVYNRIGKAGSSTVKQLLQHLAPRNRFDYVEPAKGARVQEHGPLRAAIFEAIAAGRPTFITNHFYFPEILYGAEATAAGGPRRRRPAPADEARARVPRSPPPPDPPARPPRPLLSPQATT